jgi:hypothetical protein
VSRILRLVFAVAAITPLPAAVIRGTVVEKRTGYGLSRATITLEPINAPGQAPSTAHAGETGVFEFDNVAAGSYLIRATARGFLPMEYGQQRWNSAGRAVVLDRDTALALYLPLARFSGIVGVVRDSNEVGIPDQEVAAYTNTQPPQYVARFKSDDRGVFRIGGLDPGSYLVRTTGGLDEDRGYLPTFARQTLRVEEARPVEAYLDEDTSDGDVRPIPGRLFDLSGSVSVPSQPPYQVTVTLASDMGRVISQGPVFHFPALAPGRYEIYAEAKAISTRGVNAFAAKTMGGYAEITMERDLTNYALPMTEVRDSQFVLEGAGSGVSTKGSLRRLDLAGVGPAVPVMLKGVAGVPIFPGRWEFLASPPDGYYVSRFLGARNNNANARPEGWNELLVNFGYSRFTIGLSSGAASLHGMVKSGNAPAVSAPVFLEEWDPVTRQRVVELRTARTDAHGNYSFMGLAPGDYRVLATYDYASPDSRAFDVSAPQSVRLEVNTGPQVDLELSGGP